MNTTAAPGSESRRPYEFYSPPDGSSYTARENLADILRRELLGPQDDEEEVLEIPPTARYLVGRIAPRRLDRDNPGSQDPDAVDVADLAVTVHRLPRVQL